MTTGTSRIMLALIAVAALLAVGTIYHPEWFTGLSARDRFAAQLPLMATPSQHSEVTQRRIQIKTVVIDQLLRGELGLFQAAQQFSIHNMHPQGMEDLSWKKLPGKDDGEKLCRQVLIWAESEMTSRYSHSQSQLEMERLEQELAQHIARHGSVQLETVEP